MAGPALDWSEYKIVELRRNTFDVCMSLLVSLRSDFNPNPNPNPDPDPDPDPDLHGG